MNVCVAKGHRSHEGHIMPFCQVIPRKENGDKPEHDEAAELVKQEFEKQKLNYDIVIVDKVI